MNFKLSQLKEVACELEFALWSLEKKFGLVSERQIDRQGAFEDILYYMKHYNDQDITHAVSTWFQEVENEIEESQDEQERPMLTKQILGIA